VSAHSGVLRTRSSLSRLLATTRSAEWPRLGFSLALALGLRLYGIAFSSAIGVLFGDEHVVAWQASDVVANNTLQTLRPNGWLHYLINAPVLFIISVIQNGSFNPRLVYDVPIFERVLAGRLINVVFGVATVAIVYLTGKVLSGKQAGFFAALLVALSPTLVVETHFNVTTAAWVFWMALTAYFLVQATRTRPGGYLCLALAAGLAAFFTKPIGVVALVWVALTALWRSTESVYHKRERGLSIVWLVAVLVSLCSVGWLVVTRGTWVLDLIKAFLWTYEKGTQPVASWAWMLRYEGLLLALGAVGIVRSRLEASLRWPFVVTVLLYAFGSLAFRVFYVRWLLALIPWAALFAGVALADRIDFRTGEVKQRVIVGLASLVFLFSGWNAYSLVHNLTGDLRATVWTWIRSNIPVGARIVVQGGFPSNETPPLHYRVIQGDPIVDDPRRYSDADVNYLILTAGALDYYNWRAMSTVTEPRTLYPTLYNDFDLVQEVHGTILHIPVPVRFDILRIPSVPIYPQDQIVPGDGWYYVEVEAGSGTEFRWMADEARIFYDWSSDGTAERELSFAAYAMPGRDQLSIRVNGGSVITRTLEGSGLQQVRIPVTLRPGLNEIEMVSESGCARPVVLDKRNPDTRCLSFRVANLSLVNPPDTSAAP
jgi:4-amino-4-deoxy-L-arabinose transferase-like glycosyltransferase